MASFIRSTAHRALHLKITPRPADLGQSREILRLLSQFGEIEHYRNLKYDELTSPNTALVIFKDEAAALACQKSGPLRFRMGRAQQEPQQQPAPAQRSVADGARSSAHPSAGQTRAMTTTAVTSAAHDLPRPPARPKQMPLQTEAPPPSPTLVDARIFQITMSESRANYRDQVNMGAFHAGFQVTDGRIATIELAKTVPLQGLARIGIAADVPWRVVEQGKKKEREGPTRRKSLTEVWQEGKT